MTHNNQETKANTRFSLNIDEVIYHTQPNRMYENRKPYKPINPAELKSFMPGNIPEVNVRTGDVVKEGDKLLILEAMKMKNQIIAPFAGVVKSVNVKVGDKVPKNFVLLVLEETPEPQS